MASGDVSTVMGSQTTASGENSTAMGESTTASGDVSTAMGSETTASGDRSTAMGSETTASGQSSTAMGAGTTASGNFSTAMGFQTTASGLSSTAMGINSSTNGHRGAFVYGDFSTSNIVTATADQSFVVRATGGTTFYSDAALTSGVSLPGGGNAWSTLSARHLKEAFRDEDGEPVLEKIAGLPIQSWSYRSQEPSIRHIGPTAQDFYAAFGLGESDTTITTTDIDGVNLLAIQALERRTRDLQEQLRARDREIERLRSDVNALLERLEPGEDNTS